MHFYHLLVKSTDKWWIKEFQSDFFNVNQTIKTFVSAVDESLRFRKITHLTKTRLSKELFKFHAADIIALMLN